jgi:hypothetical protein
MFPVKADKRSAKTWRGNEDRGLVDESLSCVRQEGLFHRRQPESNKSKLSEVSEATRKPSSRKEKISLFCTIYHQETKQI